jgi:acid phosphatase (class A)
MKAFGYAVLGWFCAVALLAPARAAEAEVHYIDTKAVDLRAVLANPPADGSAETKGEIEALLKLQASRTPEEVARAKSEEKFTPFAFADVLGPWFTAENLPETAALLEETTKETAKVYKKAKDIWNRPRPPLQDPRLHPAIELPDDGSYPSGHSTRGTVIALVLAELAPDLKAKLEARGRQIGDDRLIGGVHFPSDVEAGRKLGNFLFEQFKKSPEFQAQLLKAKAEFDRVRPKAP